MQKITVICFCLLAFSTFGTQARENTDVPEAAFPELEEFLRKPSELGVMAAGGVGYDGAIKILLPPAVAGNPKAQYLIGLTHMNGWGVTSNDCLATFWFDKAARLGNAEAQFALGLSYENGAGVGEDYLKAYLWVSAAIKQGLDQTQYLMENISEEATRNQKRIARGISATDRERIDAKLSSPSWRSQDEPPAEILVLSTEIFKIPGLYDELRPLGVGACR